MESENSAPAPNLLVFASRALKIGDRSDLKKFLGSSDSVNQVRVSSFQDLYFVVKTLGLQNSQDLLILATQEQRCGFIDLDCWRKDNFHISTFTEWLAAYIACGPEELARTARAIDPNILAMFLKKNVEVHYLELDEPLDNLQLMLTPDERFGIEILGKDKEATIAKLSLDAIFRIDPSLGYDLIDRIRWDQSLSLEEQGYQNKCLRLEEIGFVDYYEALSIYGESREDLVPRQKKVHVDEEIIEGSSTLPALFVASLSPNQYFWQAFQFISDRQQVRIIGKQLANLANRLMSVHSVASGNLEKVNPVLMEMRDTLNLGLEYLTNEDMKLSSTVLLENDVQAIFRVGFSIVAELRTCANRILNQGSLRLKDSDDTILEFPYKEFIEGLCRQRPLFFEGLDNPRSLQYRNFASLGDVEISRAGLKKIEILSRIFWKFVCGPGPKLKPNWFQNTNSSLEKITCGNLFVTAALNEILGKTFQHHPLTVKELHLALRKLTSEVKDDKVIVDGLINVGQKQLNKISTSKTQRKILSVFIEYWSRNAADELSLLIDQESVDPDGIQMVILK